VQDAKLKVKMNKQDSDKYSAFNCEEEKKYSLSEVDEEDEESIIR
jgi:hypothetical protein